MPVNFDINIIRGSTFAARLIAKNADGSPIDLTNYNTRGYVKHRYSDTQAIMDLNPQPVPNLEDQGYVDIYIPATGTQKLPISQGIYDIEMYSTGVEGDDTYVVKLLDGRVNIYPEVTNPGTTMIHYSDPVVGTAPSEASSEAGGDVPAGLQASIGIVAPTSNQLFDAGTREVSLSVSIQGDETLYDHWHWKTGEAFTEGSYNVAGGHMVTDGLSTTIPDTKDNRTYNVYVALVDDEHKHLPPPVTAAGSFAIGAPHICSWSDFSSGPTISISNPPNEEVVTSPISLTINLQNACTWRYVVEDYADWQDPSQGCTNADGTIRFCYNAFETDADGALAYARGNATQVQEGIFTIQVAEDSGGNQFWPAQGPYRVSVAAVDANGYHYNPKVYANILLYVVA